jgi:tRNA A37 threonylcarbamoyladenosine dehydratase
MRRLAAARVMVVGLGGVGSFAAEALARTGVGHLTLVDFDLVCVTNTNRQLHALRGNIGRPRPSSWPSACGSSTPRPRSSRGWSSTAPTTADALLADRPDYVVDAIDNLTAKAHLVTAAVAGASPW